MGSSVTRVAIVAVAAAWGAVGGDTTRPATQVATVSFVGRHHANSDANSTSFDWVGSGFRVQLPPSGGLPVGGNVTADLDFGGPAVGLAVYAGTAETSLRMIQPPAGHRGRVTVVLASVVDVVSLPGDVLTVRKVTEPFGADTPTTLFAVRVGGGRPIAAAPGCDLSDEVPLRNRPTPSPPPPSPFRIDVYGDSDTAAWGVDGSTAMPDRVCFAEQRLLEDFEDGWVRGVARRLGDPLTAAPADVFVQAVSGIGVLRPAALGGRGPAAASATLPDLLNRSLELVPGAHFEPHGWRPDVVVVYVGSNDYLPGPSPPPPPRVFSAAYTHMIERIAALYGPGPPPPILHVCGGEPRPCWMIAEMAKGSGGRYTTTGDVGVPKSGCAGHRNVTQQAHLAAHLAQLIAELVRRPKPMAAPLTQTSGENGSDTVGMMPVSL